MTRRMLADLLWEAANVHLAPDRGYSCCAVDDAAFKTGIKSGPRTPYDLFLKDLGCETGTVMSSFGEGIQRQGVRYMWLLLAMHVAEDEGIAL